MRLGDGPTAERFLDLSIPVDARLRQGHQAVRRVDTETLGLPGMVDADG
jgi:hypothetical protein